MSHQNTVVVHRKYSINKTLLKLIKFFFLEFSAAVGPDPQHMTCPSCHASIQTQMRYESTTKTHIIAAILCLFM